MPRGGGVGCCAYVVQGQEFRMCFYAPFDVEMARDACEASPGSMVETTFEPD